MISTVEANVHECIHFCQEHNLFEPIDCFLAKKILNDFHIESKNLELLLCYLFFVCRNGHICLQFSNKSFEPSLERFFTKKNINDHKEMILKINQAIITSFSQLPEILYVGSHSPLKKLDKYLYFNKYWEVSQIFLKAFIRLISSKPSRMIDLNFVKRDLALLETNHVLQKEQITAIENSINHSLSIILGGPGTGKTFTAGYLIEIILNNISNPKNFKIALVAPTGKAASNLQNSILKRLPNFPTTACTLHQLLKIKRKRFQSDDDILLPYDLILVDESSMIDLEIMAKLFSCLKSNSRLIMLGDSYQLPPVEAGNLFTDIIKILKEKNDYKPSFLNVCMRIESKDLLEYVTRIKEKDISVLKTNLSSVVYKNFLEDKTENIVINQSLICQYAEQYYSFSIKNIEDNKEWDELFSSVGKFRILSPLKKGRFGVEGINELILHYFYTKKKQIVIPIIITKNDYKLELFNGDTGFLVSTRFGKRAFFKKGTSIFSCAACILPSYDLAFCLSVHKSQGSEFKKVLLIVPEGASVFGNELFYTGATRAKNELEIWGATDVLQQIMINNSERISGIEERYNDLYKQEAASV